MALKTSLATYWNLDEPSGDFADSASSITLTNHSVGRTTGKIGGCGSFVAASSQYASTASNATVRTGDIDVTFGAWVQISTKPTGASFIMGKWGASGTREYALYYTGSLGTDRFSFIVSGTGTTGTPGSDFQGVDASTFGSPATGTWYLVLGTHDSVNNRISISVNAGTADTASWSGGIHLDTNEFALGRNPESGGTAYWNGLIDEAFISKRVWTPSEALQIYNGGLGLGLPSWDAQIPIRELRPLPNDPRPTMRALSSRYVFLPFAVPPPPPPPTAGTATPIPSVMPNIAIPGTPWFFAALGKIGAKGTFPPPPPAPPTPTGPGRGKQRPFIARIPRRRKAADQSQDNSDDYEQRQATFNQQITERLNELVRRGQLVQTEPGRWELRGKGYESDRAPTAADDVRAGFGVGMHWVDATGQQAYICVSNAAGAAVWKQVTV